MGTSLKSTIIQPIIGNRLEYFINDETIVAQRQMKFRKDKHQEQNQWRLLENKGAVRKEWDRLFVIDFTCSYNWTKTLTHLQSKKGKVEAMNGWIYSVVGSSTSLDIKGFLFMKYAWGKTKAFQVSWFSTRIIYRLKKRIPGSPATLLAQLT
jgi:hypothetical protein